MIVLTADVHGPVDFKRLQNNTLLKSLNASDYLIVCGDFGIVWGESRTNTQLLTWAEAQIFETLFIDGNHEDFTLLNNYPVTVWNGGKIHQISKNVIHLMRGQVFEIEKQQFFTFGGGFSIKRITRNSPITTWVEEMPVRYEYEEGLSNLKLHNFNVDYILTHSAPKKWLNEIDEVPNEYEKELNDYLDLVENNTKYRHWYFGHFHKDVQKEKYTVLYKKIVAMNRD